MLINRIIKRAKGRKCSVESRTFHCYMILQSCEVSLNGSSNKINVAAAEIAAVAVETDIKVCRCPLVLSTAACVERD